MALDIDTGRILENFTGTLLRFKAVACFGIFPYGDTTSTFMGKYLVSLEAPALIKSSEGRLSYPCKSSYSRQKADFQTDGI